MSNQNNNTPRFFVNTYPDYKPESNSKLEDLVDAEFWTEFIRTASKICMEKLNTYEQKQCENGIYSGNLGLIFMAFKLLQSGRFKEDEMSLKRYMYEALKINEEFHYYNNIEYTKDIGFLTGKGGLYIMGVIVSRTLGLEFNVLNYANSYNYISSIVRPIYFVDTGADELFVGRAGYLNGYLALKKYLNIESISKYNVYKICASVIKSGRRYAKRYNTPCALMYAYHGNEYIGTSHGLAGILQVILGFRDFLEDNPDAERDVKNSVDYILNSQKPDGNFPIILDDNLEDKKELIHWCHGAGGIGGQGYAHLLLYRLTKDIKYLYRASKFAEFLLTDEFKNEPRKLDAPFSLFDGLGGAICFLCDLMNPDKSEFPLMPIFDDDNETDKNDNSSKDTIENKEEEVKKDENNDKSPKKEDEEPKKEETEDSKEEIKKDSPNNDSTKDYNEKEVIQLENALTNLVQNLNQINENKSKINKLLQFVTQKISNKKNQEFYSTPTPIDSKTTKVHDKNGTIKLVSKMKSKSISIPNQTKNDINVYKKKKRVTFFGFTEQFPKRDWVLTKKSSGSNLANKLNVTK